MSHFNTKLLFHCIFSTDGRRRFLKPEVRARVFGYMRGVLGNIHVRAIAVGGTEDHVHLLIESPPTTPMAEVMRVLKANSSKWIHETIPSYETFAWQTGYAAFTVSYSAITDVRRYIEDQERHHATRSFDEEIQALLARHEIGIDEHDNRFGSKVVSSLRDSE